PASRIPNFPIAPRTRRRPRRGQFHPRHESLPLPCASAVGRLRSEWRKNPRGYQSSLFTFTAGRATSLRPVDRVLSALISGLDPREKRLCPRLARPEKDSQNLPGSELSKGCYWQSEVSALLVPK